MSANRTADDVASTMQVAENLAALEVAQNAKGQKTAVIVRDGANAFWTLPTPVKVLFQPSAFKTVQGDAAGRLSLCVAGDEQVMQSALVLDDWAVNYAMQESERLFGKKYSMEQILERYNPIVKKSDKYPPYVKLKMGTDRNAPNFWTADREKREMPEDLTVCQVLLKCRILGFWFMTTGFGVTVQVTDCQVLSEAAVVCPF
jgi:hypothetical protein